MPSQTELLFELGLNEEVVGITKFCIHPDEWFRSKTRVGGTKNCSTEKIKQLQPDLIIGNKEENDKAQIESLMQDFPVWMSDIKNLDDAIQMILSLGEVLQKQQVARSISNQIQLQFNQLKPATKKTCAYFIWKNPYLIAGSDTFINDLLSRCGLENAFASLGRYPQISAERLQQTQPEVILLSSEPYPFKTVDIAALQLLCPQAKIELVDGELFSWYGSRLLKSAAYFSNLLKKL